MTPDQCLPKNISYCTFPLCRYQRGEACTAQPSAETEFAQPVMLFMVCTAGDSEHQIANRHHTTPDHLPEAKLAQVAVPNVDVAEDAHPLTHCLCCHSVSCTRAIDLCRIEELEISTGLDVDALAIPKELVPP